MAYSTGSITLTNGQKSFSGTGTAWNSVGLIRPGYVLELPGGKHFRIEAISSDTAGTLEFAYEGSSGTFSFYAMFSISEVKALQAAQIAALIDKIDGGVDAALAGKFPDGTLAQPGMRFTADEDNGFRRAGANDWRAVAGGQDILNFGTGGLSGAAFMANGVDATAGKIATPGFANLLLDDGNANTVLDATGVDSLNAMRLSGFFRVTSDTVGIPSGVNAGMVLHLNRLVGAEAGRHLQMIWDISGPMHYRYMTNSSGDWSIWQNVAFQNVDPTFVNVTADTLSADTLSLGGAISWGKNLTIADDAVGTFTPPFKGGLLVANVSADTDFPQPAMSAVGFMDIGNSLDFKSIFTGASATVLTNNQDLSATAGTDGNVTYSLRDNGTIQVNNRSGQSRSFDIHVKGAT